ncbi:hypothetical protein [Acidisphaera sp. L21]|uniref:hypothetical protein n=1 Tax=Acidisphaera sp. L21 TaxID=1641851 RepID=UPI00131A70DD|nr:hypothetical protein [Acidisphaera sp. L21]
MRRFLLLAVLAASLLPLAGPARAQVTTDQLNKLSLEALTARPAGGGGGGGYAPRRSYRPAYRRSYRAASRYYAPRHYASRYSAQGRRHYADAPRYRGRAVVRHQRGPAIRSDRALRPTYHRPTYNRPTYNRPAYHAPAYHTPARHAPAYRHPTYHRPAYHPPRRHR